MSNLFQSLNEDGYLNDLELDNDHVLLQIGLGRMINGKFEYTDLSQTSGDHCYDLCIRAIRFQEYISRILSLTQKRKKDAEAELEEILNRALTTKRELKVTEAKAAAKGSPEYTRAARKISALSAWADYLDRLGDVLEKYHYLAKKRLDEIQSQYRKG